MTTQYDGSITLIDTSSLPIPERNYFWFLSTDSETAAHEQLGAGVYITDANIDDFKNYKQKGYIYINNSGLNLGIGNKVYTTLTTGGLTVEKGGILGGNAGQNGFVYLSTEPYAGQTTITIAGNNSNWKQIIGTQFGVTTDGSLYASSGRIAGWTITANDFYKKTNGDNNGSKYFCINAANIGTDGNTLAAATRSNNQWDFNFRVTGNGKLYATGAEISGTITAANGRIGGWIIEGGKIRSDTNNYSKVAAMQAPNSSITWVFAAGGTTHSDYSNCPFKVDKNGNLYATAGEIAGWSINKSRIEKDNVAIGGTRCGIQNGGASNHTVFYAGCPTASDGSIWNDNTPFYVLADGTLRATKATITGNITANSFSALGGGAGAPVRVTVTSDGLNCFDSTGQTVIANFGVAGNIRLGASNAAHSVVTPNGLDIYTGPASNATKVASFGSTTTIGSTASGRYNITIKNSGVSFHNNATICPVHFGIATEGTLAKLSSYVETNNSGFGGIILQNNSSIENIITAIGIAQNKAAFQNYHSLLECFFSVTTEGIEYFDTGESIFNMASSGSLYLPKCEGLPASGTRTVVINKYGRLTATTGSSKRFKHDIESLKDEKLDPTRLYDIDVVQFRYNKDRLEQDDDWQDKLFPGFIAEDIAEKYPIAAHFDKEGLPSDWEHRHIIPPMLALIQDQHKEIELLKQEINQLKQLI